MGRGVDDAYTKSLLHFNAIHRTWTCGGNAHIDTDDFALGVSSLKLDGTGDFVSITDSAEYAFASNAFCIDWRMKKTAANGAYAVLTQISTGYNGIQLFTSSTGLTFTCYNADAGTSRYWAFTPDTSWHHYALTSDGTNFRLFLDGVIVGLAQAKLTVGNSTGTIRIGIDWDGSSSSFNGYIDEFRVSNSVRWTSDFTAPTVPYQPDANTVTLLHFEEADNSTNVFDDNYVTTGLTTFRDESGKAWVQSSSGASLDASPVKYGANSANFASARITTPDHADFALGTGDFTIEAWVCPSGIPAVHGIIFSIRNTSTDFIVFSLSGDSEAGGYGHWVFDVKVSNSYIVSVPAVSRAITLGQWYHIAIERSGDVFTIYEDGVEVSADTDPGTVTMPDLAVSPTIGDTFSAGGWYWQGNIDEFRFSAGIARYAGNFTPQPCEFGSVWSQPYDSLAVSESVSCARFELILGKSLFDAVNISENLSLQFLQLVVLLSDKVNIAEYAQLIGKFLHGSAVDSVIVVDGLLVWPQQLVSTTFDSVKISDLVPTMLGLITLIYDKTVSVDFLNPGLQIKSLLMDDVTVSELLSGIFAHSLHLDDDVIISEYTHGALKVWGNWMDWKGQAPWSLGVLPDKRKYNEGDEIATEFNPVWKVDHN